MRLMEALMQSSSFRPAAAVLLLAMLTYTLPAQTITGSIVGSVVDPSGAAVVNAEVAVVQVSTGAKRSTAAMYRTAGVAPSRAESHRAVQHSARAMGSWMVPRELRTVCSERASSRTFA